MNGRIGAIIICALLAVAIPITADGSDATVRPDDHTTELAELQFWGGQSTKVTIVYVWPDVQIGIATPIPELPSGCTCWVREDTREVVNSSSVFAPGSYLITPWVLAPTPWDPAPEPEPTPEPETDKGNIEIGTTAVCIGCGAVVIAVAVLGYFAVRRHRLRTIFFKDSC